jgi:hypothetical protein
MAISRWESTISLSIEYPGESDWVDVVEKSHAIGRALVVKILVAELDLSDCARRMRERRVQTLALEIQELAIAVAVLVHSVETINTLTA